MPSSKVSLRLVATATAVWQLTHVVQSFHVDASLPLATKQTSFATPVLFTSKESWNEEHLAHDLSEVQEETTKELLESERAAAWDAHDSPDAGMEAAAEERAVMLAREMIHKRKEKTERAKENAGTNNKWNQEHMAHGASQGHEETADELLESEMEAAWDAHDAPDAGMEAAAEERAVMLAAEMVHKMKENKAKENKQK